MEYGLDRYNEPSQAVAMRMPTLKERLDLAVKQAESNLSDAKRAREILDKHPELEELMNIMQKGRF